MAKAERDRFEEQAVEEFRKGFRTYYDVIEARLKAEKGKATVAFSVSIAERADGDFDVDYQTKCSLPVRKGDPAKAQVKNGQLALI